MRACSSSFNEVVEDFGSLFFLELDLPRMSEAKSGFSESIFSMNSKKGIIFIGSQFVKFAKIYTLKPSALWIWMLFS